MSFGSVRLIFVSFRDQKIIYDGISKFQNSKIQNGVRGPKCHFGYCLIKFFETHCQCQMVSFWQETSIFRLIIKIAKSKIVDVAWNNVSVPVQLSVWILAPGHDPTRRIPPTSSNFLPNCGKDLKLGWCSRFLGQIELLFGPQITF